MLKKPLFGGAILIIGLGVAWWLHTPKQGLDIASDSSGNQSAYPEGSPQDLAEDWFETRDRDHDGFVTADEAIGYDQKLFKRIDSNGDGKLSLDEYLAGIPPDQPGSEAEYRARFAKMDANGDGYVTLDEMTGYYRAFLQRADKDGDGRVSKQEWFAATIGNKEWFPASTGQ